MRSHFLPFLDGFNQHEENTMDEGDNQMTHEGDCLLIICILNLLAHAIQACNKHAYKERI